jgi:hypothetical protein
VTAVFLLTDSAALILLFVCFADKLMILPVIRCQYRKKRQQIRPASISAWFYSCNRDRGFGGWAWSRSYRSWFYRRWFAGLQAVCRRGRDYRPHRTAGAAVRVRGAKVLPRNDLGNGCVRLLLLAAESCNWQHVMWGAPALRQLFVHALYSNVKLLLLATVMHLTP